MCEFCFKHGGGRKWYLEAANYSEDLLRDVKRQKFIRGMAESVDRLGPNLDKALDDLDRAPVFVRRVLRWKALREAKKQHYGQVVPIEDVSRIFSFVNSVVRVACLCRHLKLGKERAYCYGVSMGPNGGKFAELFKGLDASFLTGPDSAGAETVTREEALAAFREHEKEGLCHTVWTFYSPFIGGVCNCDRADCLALHTTVTRGFPVVFRAEYVCETDFDACRGCRQCMKLCPFGAIAWSAANKRSVIDSRKCYGCGICRAGCKADAIRLRPRADVRAAAGLW